MAGDDTEKSFSLRMRGLVNDMIIYSKVLDHDPRWREQMMDAVRIEMIHEIEKYIRPEGSK